MSNSLIGKPVHIEMMQKIIPTILGDKTVKQAIKKYQQQTNLPDFCHTLTAAKEWSFVNF